MEPKKLTLGQAVDAMIEGKVVAIGRAYYRVGHNFLHRKQFESIGYRFRWWCLSSRRIPSQSRGAIL